MEFHTGENTRFGFKLDFSPETLSASLGENLFNLDKYYDIFEETDDPANWIFRFELIFNALVTKFRETSQHQNCEAFKIHKKVVATFDSFASELADGGLTIAAFLGMSLFLSRTTPRTDYFSKGSEGKAQFDFSDNWKRFQFYAEYRKYWLERGKLLELKAKDPFEYYCRLLHDHGRLHWGPLVDKARFWNGILTLINFIPWAIVSHRDRSKSLRGVNPLLWENRIFSLGLDKLFQSEKKKAQQTEEEVIRNALLLGQNFWKHHQFNEEDPYVKSALHRLSDMQELGNSLEAYKPEKYYFYPGTAEAFKRMYLETKKDLDYIING